MGDYTDVITHVNPRKNQCKPWGKITQEKNKGHHHLVALVIIINDNSIIVIVDIYIDPS